MKLPIQLQFIGIAGILLLINAAAAQPLYYNAQSAAKLGADVPQRIKKIAAMLEDRPQGFGVSCRQRDFWERIGENKNGRSILTKAESLLQQPMPVLTDELYLMYSQNGNRTAAQDVMSAREGRLITLCLAECIENKGRFTAALEEVLDSSISYRSWLYPAHDGNLANFNQTHITIDLKSSRDAHNIALCLFLLDDKISPLLAQKSRAQVHKRIFEPYVRDVFEEDRSSYWKTATHNWNTVCHAGVVGAALTMLPDKLDRALFIERAMHYTDYYYHGFTADGYCSEGLGYWNYGYGHYIILSEVIYQATQGTVDVFSNPKGLAAALYPFRIEILNQRYPALADCRLNTRPQAELMGYVNARLGLADARWPMSRQNTGRGTLFDFLMFEQLDPDRPVIQPPFPPDHDQLRTWFSDAGVLICRPAKNSDAFAAVMKGGHNAEHHNHNDIGSFIVMVKDQQVILDPGSVEYTRTTFGKDRYTIGKLRSYGHPVPRVGGQEQVAGRAAQAKILRTEFTDDTDVLVMDLASAYPVGGLEKLQRTFVYQRRDAGTLELTDEVAFANPNTFETALITYGTCRTTGPGRLEVTFGGQTVIIQLESGDNDIEIADEVVASSRGDFRRIAVRFVKPVKKGKISMRIWPK
ncbi:MAG: heparinase II/III-family protein [Planctomycetales bacterium]|nr:heparinase II/III-family protein [Planctomycetales bacterium]